ncbi:MAG: alkaline phosphatase [Sulfuricurvum sp.]|uniref:alkaline phosphatase D family protein n=1 Tax=Sulfuricurvum sp. TaxID=2025608 RepID=UPI00262E2F96|nr:alkaline phosphatase D family protein [uncultured Sulfuricurvum sp.]
MYFTRREFLKVSAMAACTLVVSTGLSGCNDDGDINVAFNHGVASGDPLSDRVIIWTRITPEESSISSVRVSYQVATDAAFSHITNSGTATANSSQDYTVKIDVQNLLPYTQYYYRFWVGKTYSVTGKAKTLPTASPDQVKMAVFSCSNYPKGYFNVFSAAATIDDLDVTLHIGDYIYEYGMYVNDDFTAKVPAYGTEDAISIGRALPSDNNTECITLNDYRKRYALYHTDSGMQAIHAACPMIAVWDDHEIANDAYKSGAENHDVTEGSYDDRVAAALQAYFEWIPIRPVSEIKKIYRTFDFGGLVSLHMLETRLCGRDKQLNYSDYYTPAFDSAAFVADLTSPARSMIGSEELAWLQGTLATSSATWQVIGQQVLMGKMNLPAEILGSVAVLQSDSASDAEKAAAMSAVNTSITELTQIKVRISMGDPTVTSEEAARVNTVLPYNLDAWDGYYYEREVIYASVRGLDKNLVVLAGDTHNGWASNLKDSSGNQIGVEFATSSVSSPGMEEYLAITSTGMAQQLEAALTILVDDLEYANLNNRGFLVVTFTAEKAEAQWKYVDSISSTTYNLLTDRETTYQVFPGSENRTLVRI